MGSTPSVSLEALFDRIAEADAGIRPQVPVTPLERSVGLSAALGCEVLLKCEHLQPTGSFKVRGAANKIRLLDAAARRAGVITASTGNHGQGVARAGALAGVAVTVYVAPDAAPEKLAAIRALGADVVVVDGLPIDAELQAREQAEIQGKTYVSPYNDLDVVAGQGTVGVEIAREAPDLDAVFVAVGGGGLIAGIGSALRRQSPRTQIVGVWPENSPCLLRALEAGEVVDTPEQPTLSDATAGAVEPGSVTLPICLEVIRERLTVSEREIARALQRVAESDRWIVEGAAGVALAGLLQTAERWRGGRVAAVLCGRNIALTKFIKALKHAE
jgi:threonine dehydratase